MDQFELLISSDKIAEKVQEIATELDEKFKDETPIFIGVLNGSFMFMADLIRQISIDCELDFIKLSSYHGSKSSGTVRLLKDISADITGKHVVIVEDIVDSGLTIGFIKERMSKADPASLTLVTFLLKPDLAKLDFPIDIVGFEISPEFVVGYGLDYEQKYRNFDGIYRLKEGLEDI
ncbi:MAG: hypoxanthine phosphoribosyltransferase [Candidatus Marinimicrobia bacterium]|jgi:hypoxanthine phosphoribosyltransferase|nr:hypoxanthine phosphoribosyltransferase [Candidatus Neomarinimicrobiota bacterium]MBT3618434.1 hypoxanthine phosphoribosyltransferase [Candidatus Neomarinimicrobiota bacterium]MBT3829010.1 hypoxanthine phosphoribosyltransferase [Candidatus Neomarinimicrobiota bacterium]MBT3997947.1 hypoxanthine phosphoribosyltransferase [Candidatus Neomarinimicrobiota bacterium]MBT4280029.1 hypoxanthine phosphoribosyltransferase [Candidatus Neomarinimicrobiota bacterium]